MPWRPFWMCSLWCGSTALKTKTGFSLAFNYIIALRNNNFFIGEINGKVSRHIHSYIPHTKIRITLGFIFLRFSFSNTVPIIRGHPVLWLQLWRICILSPTITQLLLSEHLYQSVAMSNLNNIMFNMHNSDKPSK